MPIYEYQCRACGGMVEVIQKMSDQPLSQCSHCHKQALEKCISATSFHLKGDGWYVTDFKDKGTAPSPSSQQASTQDKSSKKDKTATTPAASIDNQSTASTQTAAESE